MKLQFFILLLSMTAFSQEFVLDPSFGTNGYSLNSETVLEESFSDIAQQSDGKIIANSNYNVPDGTATRNKIVILRYNQNGTLDNSFGTAGKYYIDNTTYRDRDSYIKVLPDDKILVTYTAGLNNADIVTLRLNADGTLDTSFGVAGYAIANFFLTDVAKAMTVQPDHKILIAGTTANDFTVMRYLENGTIDTGFGLNGLVKQNIGNSIYNNTFQPSIDHLSAITLQSDGKIILAGGTDANNVAEHYDFVLLRLNSDGSSDDTFGTAGKTITGFANASELVEKIVINSADEIILMGNLFYAIDNYKIAVAKYNSNGILSETFGNNGTVELHVNDAVIFDYGYDLKLLPDGKLMIGGGTTAFSNSSMLLAKLNEDGTFDTSFSGDGMFTPDTSEIPAAGIIDTIILPDGNILISGILVGTLVDEYDSFIAKLIPETLSSSDFDQSAFDIYPNPTNQFLNIQNLSNESIEKITVSDLTGKILMEPSGNCSQINVQSLPQGMYFIQILSQGKTTIQKFIKE